jgi:lipopolysaccharide transport protein LptA
MISKLFKIETIITIIALFGITVDVSSALPADEKTQTKLSADSAICKRQGNENICAYLGNAKFNQGAMNLQAQQITIYRISSGKINKIVASGEHSHYSTVIDSNQKPVDADANLITIYPDKNLMVLEGNGQITAGQDTYSGPHIVYQFQPQTK